MEVAAFIRDRAASAGLEVPPALAQPLARYLELLAQWNRRINLTALPLSPPRADAVDRLIVEPLRAAILLRPTDRRILDVGSGGGSPAIPMKLASPACRFTLVEVKDRKSAFLREVVRQLGLTETEIRTARVEDLPAPEAPEAADVVTLRAVRVDEAMVRAIRRQMRPAGRLLWFRTGGPNEEAVPTGLRIVGKHPIWTDLPSRIVEARLDPV